MIHILLLSCSFEDNAATPIDLEQYAPPRESDITVEDVGADVEFSSAKQCGECHPNQFSEWQQSMHAYAAHSPVFDAMAQKAFRDTSGEVGTFCTGCHSPIGTIYGEDGMTTASERSDW